MRQSVMSFAPTDFPSQERRKSESADNKESETLEDAQVASIEPENAGQRDS